MGRIYGSVLMKELTNKEFDDIRTFIKQNYGISLGDEKRSLVYSRLRSCLAEHGFTDFTQYFNYLVNDRTGAELKKFVNRITTNHTYFMREADHFYYFRDKVLPAIAQNNPSKDFRLWCAASSSGEEPYTLMMIINDFFKDKPGWDYKILATDISTNALEKAIRGVYSNESLEPLPAEWRKRYFTNHDSSSSKVSDELKNQILYRRFNLMDDTFPFKKKFNVIFARNVMIYFDNETRDNLVEKFYFHTDVGGWLFIGHSESLSHSNTKYKFVIPALYTK
jgi:chemotaxis protein methyltransferase CheR